MDDAENSFNVDLSILQLEFLSTLRHKFHYVRNFF